MIVSTDDEKVIEIAKSFDDDRIIIKEREAYYASSECSNDEFIQYLCRTLPYEGHLLRTHVTSPLMNEITYERAIQTYYDNLHEYDSLVSATEIKAYLWNVDGEPISYDAQVNPWPKSQDLTPLYDINSGIFLIDMDLMRKIENRFGHKPYIFATNKFENVDIDRQQDFVLAELMYTHFISNQTDEVTFTSGDLGKVREKYTAAIEPDQS